MAVLIKANNTTAYNQAGAWTPAQVPTSNDTTKVDATANGSVVSGSLTLASNATATTVGSIWIDAAFSGTNFRPTTPITLNNTPDTANGAPNYSLYVPANKNFQTISGLSIGASASNHKFFIGTGGTVSLNSYGTAPNSTFGGSGRISLYGGGSLYQGLTSTTGTYSGGFDLFDGYLVVRGDTATLPLGLATNTVVFSPEVGKTVGIKAGLFSTTRTIPNPVTFTGDGTIAVGDAAAPTFRLTMTGTFSGSGKMTVNNWGASAANIAYLFVGPSSSGTFNGQIELTGGVLWMGATSGTAFTTVNPTPNATRYDVDGPYAYLVFGGGPYDVTSEIYLPNTAPDRGFLAVQNNVNGASDGVFFKSSLANIAWNTAPATSATTAISGGFYVLSGSGSNLNPTATVIDFPDRVSLGNSVATTGTVHLKYKGAGGVSYATSFDLYAQVVPTATHLVYLYADQQTNTAQGITLSGNITKYGSTSTTFGQILVLAGSNTADNTISGNIGSSGTNTSQVLGVEKLGTGKWVLSGDNSYFGNTYVDAGTLALANPNAIRESALDWRNTPAGTLSFEGGFSLYNVGSILTSVSGSRALTIPAGITLSVGGASWITSATTHDFGTVLAGAGTFKKVGAGNIYFTQIHTLTGDLVMDGGSLNSYPSATVSSLRSAMMFGSVSSITLNNAASLYDQPQPASAITTTIPTITLNGTSTYSSGAWSTSGGAEVINTFTGTFSGTGTLALAMYNQALAGNRVSSIKTNSLPGGFSYNGNGSAGATRRGIYRWSGTANSVFPTNISISIGDGTAATHNTYLFSNDSANNSTIEIQGTIDKYKFGSTGTAPATLEVAGSGDIKFSGIIKETDVLTTATATLGIWKYGTNTLTLSGANTFRGDTRVQSGGLRLDNELALQNSGLDWTNADTGTIDLASAGLSAYTFGGLKSTTGGTGRTLALPAGLTLSVGNSLALTHSFGTLLTGNATTTLKKIGTNSQTITSNNTGFLGAVVVDGGALGLGAVPTATRALPGMASLTVNNGGSTTEFMSVATAVNHPVTVNAGGTYTALAWLAADTGELDLQQGITGAGTLDILASNLAVAATRYARTKTTTLPGDVNLSTVGVSGAPRYARLLYSGVQQSYPTNFRLRLYASPVGLFGWSIYNVGTGKLTISGNISKQNEATFSLTTAGTLTVGDALDTNDIELSGNIIQGPGETGALSVTKAGPRTLTISGTASTYTGGLTHQTGTTVLKHGTALGAPGGAVATVLTAGTVEIDGGGSDLTFSKGSSAFTFGSASALTVKNTAGANTVTMASASLGGSVTFEVTASTSLSLGGAISGVLANKLTKTAAGKLSLTALTSGYLGPTEVRLGTLEVKKLNLAGQTSSIGAAAVAQATIELGADGDAGILHTGTAADQTDRNLSFLGAAGTVLTVDSSGTSSGSVTFTAGGTLAFSTGDHTFVLAGTNSTQYSNTWARVIPDGTGGGATSLKKMGSNLWNVTVAPTLTGTVEVAGGTLYFDGQARTLGGGLIMSGGTLTNDAALLTFTNSMVLAGGTVEANLAGTGLAVQANAGLTVLTPASGTNPGLTGTADINNGAIVKMVTETITTTSNGIVMGGLNVTVKSGGTLMSPTGTLQRGRARFNGNLTFEAGSNLKIGGA